jgi:hypothetical protein
MSPKKKKYPKPKVVGHAQDNKLIIDGAFVLFLMDTRGMSFDIISTWLSDKDMGFDVVGFVKAAKLNPNFKKKKILAILLESAPPGPEIADKIRFIVNEIYGDEE